MAARPLNSFAERRKMALDQFREQVIESQSQLSSVTLQMPNGEEYEIPHPMLIPDEAQTRLEIVQGFRDLDRDADGEIKDPPTVKGKPAEPIAIRIAKALLGEAEHKKFIAAGGHSNDITLAWQMLSEEHKELAEADPK
ncbi:hypothetical protein MINTMi27_15230 [Mycobacterium intracellulare]|uniref:hypothetical protein n=1 Tax=Mycobacterium intracellulare TaxID=1767 RepID=UPI001928C0A3|nr:hypothetical protein [Mycobacterium intracellulare]BCP41430.1 hypothetical protein MINTMi27_15230 [Mycobacterium intracellulare]